MTNSRGLPRGGSGKITSKKTALDSVLLSGAVLASDGAIVRSTALVVGFLERSNTATTRLGIPFAATFR